MTSNLGSEYILEDKDNANEEVMKELRNTFKPEFINRIDEIIIFKSLTKDIVYDILDKIIKEIEVRLSDKLIKLELTDKAKDYIINESYDPSFGARPIKRYVVRNIESLIAREIVKDNIKYNSKIVIDIENNEFVINNTK